MFSAVISANGDVLVPEGRLRAAMTLASVSDSAAFAGSGPVALAVAGPPGAGPDLAPGLVMANEESPADGFGGLLDAHGPRHPALGGSLEQELSLLLGQPWDDELEPFRHAAAGAPVRWLHATG
jgi:Protein of unknown function (DUF3145)